MILDKIVETKKKRIEELKIHRSLKEISQIAIKAEYTGNSFINAIEDKNNLCDFIALIAEVKKASPSKGIISNDFNYLDIAKNYEKNGATAISILTEEDFFKGSNKILQDIRECVSLPILRKDFIVDEYQIYESKLLRADCILLILRILEDETLKRFYDLANEMRLDVLFEVHNQVEIERALNIGAKMIGINNRDLDTFEVDISHSEKLSGYIPKDIVRVSESGIKTADDMMRLKKCGFDAVLVGETLMRAESNSNIRNLIYYKERKGGYI